MGALPTLDAHAHVNPLVKPSDLAESGAVLAQTSSLDDAVVALGRNDENLAWGVGCHPRFPEAQRAFDAERYRSLLVGAAVAGEVGLDSRSKVRLDDQTRVLREIFETVAEVRLISWRNLGTIVELTGTRDLLPVLFRDTLARL